MGFRVGQGLVGARFKPGAGPRLRTFEAGQRQHVQRGPECGVPDFGGKTLSEGVCVGLGPAQLEGGSLRVQRWGPGWGCRGGPWALHGRREAPRAGQMIRPGSLTYSLVPRWAGKALATLPSFPPLSRGSLPLPLHP